MELIIRRVGDAIRIDVVRRRRVSVGPARGRDGGVVDLRGVNGGLERALQPVVGSQEATVDEVGHRHEGSAVANFLHDFVRQVIDLGVRELAVAVPSGLDADVRHEVTRKAAQDRPAGGRAIGHVLSLQSGQHGLPGLLGRGVHVEPAIVEGVAGEVGWVRELGGQRERRGVRRGLEVGDVDHALVREGIIPSVHRIFEFREGVAGERRVARGFLQRI